MNNCIDKFDLLNFKKTRYCRARQGAPLGRDPRPKSTQNSSKSRLISPTAVLLHPGVYRGSVPHGNRILDPFLASISPVRTNTATILHSRIRKSVVVSGDATTNLAKMELRPPLLGIFPLPFGPYRTHPALLRNFS